MDQEKIGKFIAELRKENGFTQAALAEKLGITDRAVSKWENGKSLPDASIMLELCNLLKINVNELLTGERITTMDNYTKIAEQNLLDMKKREEGVNKRLLNIEKCVVVLTIFLLLVLSLSGAFVAKYYSVVLGVILITSASIVAVFACVIGLSIEHEAGYYECQKCKHRYVPTMKQITFAPHIGTSRKLVCPCCGDKNYHKKTLTQ